MRMDQSTTENNQLKQNKPQSRRLFKVLIPILIIVIAIFVVMAIEQSPSQSPTQPKFIGAEMQVKEVTLVIESPDGKESSYSHDLVEGMTAFDLFALNGVDIKYKEYSFGKLVEEINSVTSGEDNKYWIYYINGQLSSALTVISFSQVMRSLGDLKKQRQDFKKFSIFNSPRPRQAKRGGQSSTNLPRRQGG